MNVNVIVLLFSLVLVSEAFLGRSRNYIRFRRPDDVWEPPFRTVLCGSFPIRVQIYADPDEVCQAYLKRLRATIDAQE